ncbi:hypothetical protein EGJ71_04585 [Stutzerimonas stutzeri]|nr:hypothetical protein EGJ71_04585 [Stutzerimonas stutzeri]RRW22298.1 hypothetical protein EGJ43_03375 [Stutzerimonas stutzeri]
MLISVLLRLVLLLRSRHTRYQSDDLASSLCTLRMLQLPPSLPYEHTPAEAFFAELRGGNGSPENSH